MRYRIREAREAHGWTQAELAERARTTQQSIQRYESGEREPRTSAIVAIAAACGVTVSYILGLDDGPWDALSDDEARLVALYRSTDARGKAAIMRTAEGESGVERRVQGAVTA
jgi:transcriptional regulator with XRE-family HTH domain